MDPLKFIQLTASLALFGHGFAALIQWTTFMPKIAWPFLRHVVPDGTDHPNYQAWKDESALDDRLSRHLLPDLTECHYCLAFWSSLALGLTIMEAPFATTVAASVAAAGAAVLLCRVSTSLTN